tara:strand:+ start:4296 stop:6038 length:1743 start_codon:yes stop_codon:yes gene_type:complete
MKELKYSEILKLNKELENNLKSSTYNISVLSNITIHQIKEILEYGLRYEDINANVVIGDYDNIVQDSQKYRNSNAVIIFWELCNLIDGLYYKIELIDNLDEIINKTQSAIDLILTNLEDTSIVLINKFTSLSFSNLNIKKSNLEYLADQLNKYLVNRIPENVRLVELEKVITNIGLYNSLDMRYYYSSKALYTLEFFKAYVDYVKPYVMSANGKSKKALIFDCDNTLWKGILGEDGFHNIEMSSRTKDGAIFADIQSIALSLNKQGILIGLCSKNNLSDVNEVLESHIDMQLRGENITINKSNWMDKVTNLKEISEELNISLDSIVFVDDSSFEINLIKEELPEITVLQVPEKLYMYPKMLQDNLGLFYNLSFTKEDIKKTEMYKHQIKRESSKKEFTGIEDYLASLELKITIFKDDESIIPRMSQMTQKTNQFNVTTQRYTESDIVNFLNDSNSIIYAFSVSDKFGDSGITGLCIVTVNWATGISEIDTFLMSCRVIGRNIEYVFIDYIIKKLKEKKIITLKAKHIHTKKNEQVKKFFDSYSFDMIDKNNSVSNYKLDLSNHNPKKINYIEVVNGNKNG